MRRRVMDERHHRRGGAEGYWMAEDKKPAEST